MNTRRRPRILHCITWLRLGGAERMAVSLAHELHDRFEFAVHAILGVAPDAVGRDLRDELRSRDIPCSTGTLVPPKLGGLVTGAHSLTRTIRRFRPDIIHLHTETPEATYAAAIALHAELRSIPLVRTIHNSRYWHHWRAIGRWTERRLPPAHIAAVSRDALAAFETHAASAKLAHRPHDARIILNGVRPPASSVTLQHSPRAPLRLLFAGRFDPQKGADLLPEILQHLASAPLPACELTIAGQGECAGKLRDLPRFAPPGWRILLREPIERLAARLPEFDVVLMPSRFEGLSLLAIETLMHRKPLVATRAPGLRETFPPDYPWLAEPGSAGDFARVLRAVLDSPTDWRPALDRAHAFVSHKFSLSKMTARYADLYTHVAGPLR